MEIKTVFTIGHSNQSADNFIALLKTYNIEEVFDVRTKPYSRFRHFSREPLRDRLARHRIQYVYMGEELGGHPEHQKYYSVHGRVVYQRLATSPDFRRGLRKAVRAIEECERNSIALMCTEEDPAKCHRHPLLAKVLMERGLEVLHIRRDGSVQNAADVSGGISTQLPLVEPVGEDLMWQSPKRIRPRSHD